MPGQMNGKSGMGPSGLGSDRTVYLPHIAMYLFFIHSSSMVLTTTTELTISWPSHQVMDIGAAMGRVQKYFIDGSAADLRQRFEIIWIIGQRQTGDI